MPVFEAAENHIALSRTAKRGADMDNNTIRETATGEILNPSQYATQNVVESPAKRVKPTTPTTGITPSQSTIPADIPSQNNTAPKRKTRGAQKARSVSERTPSDTESEDNNTMQVDEEPVYEIDEIMDEQLMYNEESKDDIPHIRVKWTTELEPEWIPTNQLNGTKMLEEYRSRQHCLLEPDDVDHQTLSRLYRIAMIEPKLLSTQMTKSQYPALDPIKIKYLQSLGLQIAAKKVEDNTAYKVFLVSIFQEPNIIGIKVKIDTNLKKIP